MNNRYFDSNALGKHGRNIGKFFLYLLLTLLIGMFIGCGIANGNPFAIFFPSTWIHFFKFLK